MKVYKSCCKNCLLSPDAIVSTKRRKDIIQTCAKEQTYFIRHQSSMGGDDICCNTFYERMGHMSQLVRIAQRLDVVEFVDQPDSEKLPPHKDMSTK